MGVIPFSGRTAFQRVGTRLSVYPRISVQTFGLFPPCGRCEWRCERVCTSVCLSTRFQFWGQTEEQNCWVTR